jgi:hypothetical protein
MFGDNNLVVNNSMTPDAKFRKRHNALSLHRVREAIAPKIIRFYHIASKSNVGYNQVWPLNVLRVDIEHFASVQDHGECQGLLEDWYLESLTNASNDGYQKVIVGPFALCHASIVERHVDSVC